MTTDAQFLEALKAAYYRGVQNVWYKGNNITYRSRADMQAIISELERKVGGPGSSGPDVLKPSFSKGY